MIHDDPVVSAVSKTRAEMRSGGGVYIDSFMTQNNGTMEFNDCSSLENGAEPQRPGTIGFPRSCLKLRAELLQDVWSLSSCLEVFWKNGLGLRKAIEMKQI